jgi:glucose/arabinose dehydrogenase
MRKRSITAIAVIVVIFAGAAVSFSACGEKANLPLTATIGQHPTLPPPKDSLLPTVHIAPAKGWPSEEAGPKVPAGLKVALFADQLQHPRNVYVLPNGDVLVVETDAPPKPKDGKGIKGIIYKQVQKAAGANSPSANRITLLRDSNGDGKVDSRSIFLENLNSPFGVVLVGNDLYVADTDAVRRFPYEEGQTRIAGPGEKIVDLPAGLINHHWTKNIVASGDGKKLYVSIGSNSNVGENGIEAEEGRAAIWEIDRATGDHRIYASGLRNPNGLAIDPATGQLWTSVNERDELGSDLVPDYMTAVKEGGFYGWPYSYYGQHLDDRMKPQRDDLVQKAIVPDYALGAHTASLAIAFSRPGALPQQLTNGVFVGQHGSWNRRPRSGYDVIFVPFKNGQPSDMPSEVLNGFIDKNGNALGRPVGVALDRQGALLVADDVGNRMWRLTGDQSASAPDDSAQISAAPSDK